jgi:hypothetical protein|tara:strand:+ start:1343 stop:2086 length:744 start_codon:yes stop_codon:yes gene_type:complete
MFSYSEFKNIINLIKINLPIIDFADVTSRTKSFCVVRHDIEFAVDRALEMARIEADELGISSTYTVQLRNNTYNALSEKNIKAVQEIHKLGHKIGLHQNPPNLSAEKIQENVLKDIEVLQHYYEFEIDRFAFHRPNLNPQLLAWYVKVDNLINCNGQLFFHYFKKEKPENLNVTYLSDSNHLWKFGHPLEIDFSEVKKLHVLMHPFSWSETGYQNYSNFVSLIRERNKELLHSMDSETSTFPTELLS